MPFMLSYYILLKLTLEEFIEWNSMFLCALWFCLKSIINFVLDFFFSFIISFFDVENPFACGQQEQIYNLFDLF